MFRRFKGLLALFGVICVTAVAGGTAMFYFGYNVHDEKTITNDSEEADGSGVFADNILENYEFGAKTDLNETYTYYFYPSTLYMSNEFFNANTNPEDIFGYNEVILDDNGNPVLVDGQPQYEIVNENIAGIQANGTSYDTYYHYLKNYLNSQKSSYLYGAVIEPNYNHTNRAGSTTTPGNVFAYGIGFPNDSYGDDYHLQGIDVSIKDPYIVNNKNIVALDALLKDNLNMVYYGNKRQDGLHSYDEYYDFFTNNQEITNVNYNDEVLSPQYNDDFHSISLEITTEQESLIYNFANYYQRGSSSRIDGNTLRASGHINFDYGWEVGMWRDDYLDRINDNTQLVDHSPFYYDSGDIHSIGLDEISRNPELGTWFTRSNDRNDVTLAFTSFNGSQGTGYIADSGGYGRTTFTYRKNNGIITFNTSEHNIEGSLTISASNPLDQMINRAQYRNDRFGFWTSFYDWDDDSNKNFKIENSASRYLPIKITVNGNLTPDDMAKVIPTLSASMSDVNMWFDFTSNIWTYVPTNNKGEYDFNEREYTTGTGGFTAKDIKYIFDIMQNPSKYADKDGNIRLFPVFSNGKNKGNDAENGGADAIQASFTYKDGFSPTINDDLLPSSTKMTYSTFDYQYGDFYNYPVNYAVLKNVEITKNKYEQLTIRIDTTYTNSQWSGNWIDLYTFSGDALNSFISTYGEGLYTFYLFVGARATNEDRGSTPFPDVNEQSLIERIVNYNVTGNELHDKYLLPLSVNNDESIGVGGVNNVSERAGYKYAYIDDFGLNTVPRARPVALAVEKVTNLRLVSDIPIKEDSNGNPSVDQDWGDIDNNLEQGLLNAKNFTIADEVYGINDPATYENGLTQDDLLESNRLDTNNPYIYVIQNADFRFVNNLYFQIRFSNSYINNAMNVVTDYSGVEDTDETPKYVAYSISGQIMTFKFQDSKDDDVFISNVSAEGASAEGGTSKRQGFKLKDYNARGIYDILLVSTGTTGGRQYYNMYINRHTNSFIKLFYGNPGTFRFNGTGAGEDGSIFVSHKIPSELKDDKSDSYQMRDINSTLLWNGQTYLGEYLTTSSTGIRYSRKGTDPETELTDESVDKSFFAAIVEKCDITPGTDSIYEIVDAVTQRVVAYYNAGVGRLFTSDGSTGSSAERLNLFTIDKNYVLYINPPSSN